MKIRITNVPKILKPSGRAVLHEELTAATLQIGGEYRATVVRKIETSKPREPFDDGNLKGGITYVPQGDLAGVVAPSPVSHPYDIVQELGRRPGQPGPPLAPILSWVLRKGIASGKEAKRVAFLIRRKLHVKGMPGRFFFRRARADQATRQKAMKLVRAAIRRWREIVT